MPIAIPTAEFPTITRTRTGSQHRELIDYTVSLCTDEKRRVTECFAEALEGTTSEEQARSFAGKAQAVRNAAKSVGATVTVILRDEKMYVQYNGEYKAMTPEQLAERAAAREATKAAKAEAALIAKSTAAGAALYPKSTAAGAAKGKAAAK